MNLESQSKNVRVLMVCMGNICRSPTAEGVLRHALSRHAPYLNVEVDSAGTHDYHIGEPPDRRSIAHAKRRAIDLSGLRARQLLAEDFQRFDWIVCMDAANVRAAERLRPEESCAQLARLLDWAPDHLERDVPDPYYGGAADFERVLDLVERAVLGLIEELRQPRRSSSQTHQRP
jgi:protein-tyrosine phosphatase